MSADTMPVRARWPLAAALAYTAFPIYGSLVPFRWTPVPIPDALDRFGAVLQGPVVIASRADFAANVLLAFPLALLWLAAVVAVTGVRRRTAVVLAGVFVWLACVVFALSLEFSQIFFGGRRPALSDCVAQSIGAALGVVCWWFVPRSFWQPMTSANQRWRRWAGLYLAGVVLYALLPLDLTVSRSDLAAKWVDGKVHPVPFLSWQGRPLLGLIDFVLDAAIWALAAFLVGKAGAVSAPVAAWALIGLAVALEAAQTLVLSRVVDTTDILAAMVGVGAVAMARRSSAGVSGVPTRHGAIVRLTCASLAAVVIVGLQSWPFDFATDAAGLRARLGTMTWLPFASYATNAELYLVTNLLRRLAQYGLFAVVVTWSIRAWRLSGPWEAVLVSVSTGGLAAAVETLQLFLPGRIVDTGDVIIGAVVGLLVPLAWPRSSSHPAHEAEIEPASSSRRAMGLQIEGQRTSSEHASVADGRFPASSPAGAAVRLPRASPSNVPLRTKAMLGVAAVLAASLPLAYLPQVPYNVRELLAPDGVPWPAVAVMTGALILFGAPGWIARQALPDGRVPLGSTAAALAGVPFALALLLYVGVPLESVHDIVGSPVLGVAPSAEMVGRLTALLLGAVWALALGAALGGAGLPHGGRGGSVAHLMLHGLWVVPVWHLIVVAWAGTDNLTELMADGGGLQSTACLLAYATLLAMTGSAGLRLVTAASMPRTIVTVVWVVISVALGWWLLRTGTESEIVKYGQVFSALQFLLSVDRAHFVDGGQLLLRFVVAHLAVSGLTGIALLAFAAWMPFRSAAGRPPAARE
ncbi:MAG: VanZ family protein [Rubrivivax sp.]|nr:VanZ family protein [Rubrivivax sp.]